LNLTNDAAMAQYGKKVGILLQRLEKDRAMQLYTGSLQGDLENLRTAIYRARLVKGTVSVDIELISRIELALVEYIEEDQNENTPQFL